MADVMDLPPEPLPRDSERRKGGGDDSGHNNSSNPVSNSGSRRRGEDGGKDDNRQSNRYEKHSKRGRKSLSPPPLPHRDRRHSPPRRSSPGHKRSRREDDRGFDSRDGILGRGYGGDYGRHRQSDWQARGGYGDAGYGNRRDGFMSYKQFIAELEDDILPAEAERRYEEYKAEYIATQKRAYFEQHKDADWLRDKYDPTRLETVLARRIESSRASARDFQLDLQAGSLDMGAAAVSGRASEAAADEEKRRNRKQDGAPPQANFASSEMKRVVKDIEQAQALIRKLDGEKGIEGNVLCPSDQPNISSDGPIIIVRGANQVKGLEGLELLEVMLTYLWRVHSVDYYGMTELREAPKGNRHVRGGDGKPVDETARAEWEKKLDFTWQTRLQGSDPLEAMLGKEKLEASSNEALTPYVRKIRDEKYGFKYGCLAAGCSKLFHGPEFVHKHIKLKHPELVAESMAKIRKELYFQNYMSDPNAPGAASIQTLQRDSSRSHKRRPGLLGNPDRHRGRGDDGDKSPGRDYGSAYDGAGPSSSEQQAMFEAFPGPGMHGPAFGTEIPPPVLMPVPGAGPLGPFVPAPPDVTMRMWREHGGPQTFAPAFEAAFDGDRARKGRGVLDAPPMVPPSVRHDPRNMRSYHDLDAPEDDVTVIDYRSI